MKSKNKNKRHIELTWQLLEEKAKYYGYAKGEIISDQKYDALEEEYKALCKELKKPTSVTDTVGFPLNSPSGRLVLSKLGVKE
jgi:NAD-dependent DNA ligase